MRFTVPNYKIKWDRSNPTGHGIIFIGIGGDVFCYLGQDSHLSPAKTSQTDLRRVPSR